MSDKYWVGVVKGRYENHEVFVDNDKKHVTPKNYPNYDYIVGPFDNKSKAEAYAKKVKNNIGTFFDPFCNHGEGR